LTVMMSKMPGMALPFEIILMAGRRRPALSQILQVNSMLTMGREVAAPDIAERADDFEYHCRKAEAPVEG
jgi:hypothetical protein